MRRETIEPGERLCITLRYIITGDAFLLSNHFSLLFTQIVVSKKIFFSLLFFFFLFIFFLRVHTIETTNNRKNILFSDWLK